MKSNGSPVFRPRRLGHVNLFVDDLQRSTDFYHAICGLTVEFTELGLKAQFLGTGHTPHDLGMIETTKGVDRYGKDGHLQIPGSIGRSPSLNHLAWEMETEAELVDAISRCRREGIAVSRLADHQIAHSAYLSDPDGNPLEFYVDTIRDWRKVLQGDVDLITSVWDPAAAPPSRESLFDPAPQLDVVDDAILHPARLTHVVLVSDDPDRLAAFYSGVGGLGIVHRHGAARFLRGSDLRYDYNLAILPADGTAAPGMHHFSFELPSTTEIGSVEKRLAAAGTAIERTWKDDRKESVFLVDPDGMRAEFYVRRRDGYPAAAGAGPIDAYAA